MLSTLMKTLACVALVAALAPLAGCNGARDNALDRLNAGKTGFLVKDYKRPNGEVRKFGLFIPANYNAASKYPTIVFLHGVGEGGSDARANLRVGLAPFVADKSSSFDSIVIFPQSSSGGWADAQGAADVVGILDQVQKEYAVDTDRVALTGLSTGGVGTWYIGSKHPNRFAALAPMGSSGSIGDDEAKALAAAKIPIRAYCNPGDMFAGFGMNDPGMVDKVKKYGGNAEFEVGRGSGHNVWEPVYGDGSLFAWIKTKRLSARGVTAPKVSASIAPEKSTSSASPAKSSVTPSNSGSGSSALVPATPY